MMLSGRKRINKTKEEGKDFIEMKRKEEVKINERDEVLTAYKTIEFKLQLTKTQEGIVDGWLETLRKIWNHGLGLLLEFHHHKYYEWVEKTLDIEIPPHDRRYLFFSRRTAFAATCRIAAGLGRYPVEPLPIRDCALKNDTFFGLSGLMTKRYLGSSPDIKALPSCFIKGKLRQLVASWIGWKKKVYAQPRFKSYQRGDKIKSLFSCESTNVAIEGDKIKIPGFKQLGWLKIVNKNLTKRWPSGTKVQNLKIVKRASGYYLQLLGVFERQELKDSIKYCGIDVGLQYLYSDDAGKQIGPPAFYRKSEKKLRRLQRKLSRQVFKSANWYKTSHKIALLHEKIRMQRRNFNHKLSTYMVRTFEGIAVEDIQIANLNRRPKPKEREDGKGYAPNNAAAKSGLNKSFGDAGLGQLLTMIEMKAKDGDRQFVKVNPSYTSQDCPCCGDRQKKSLSQRTHACKVCGYVAPRDIASALAIKAKAGFQVNVFQAHA